MTLETQLSSQKIVATRSDYTPSSMMIVGLKADDLDTMLQAVGYDFPPKIVSAIYDSLSMPSKPLEFPHGERPYTSIGVSEEKRYTVRPVGEERRIRIEEEIMFEMNDVPIVILRSGDLPGQFDFEIIFDSDVVDDDESWAIVERLGKLAGNHDLSKDELEIQKINAEDRHVTYIGDGISVNFAPNSFLSLPATKPDCELEKIWVPYVIQLVNAPEEVEKKIIKQFHSEKADEFAESGMISLMKDSLDNVEELPFEILGRVKNDEDNIRFRYCNEFEAIEEESIFDDESEEEEEEEREEEENTKEEYAGIEEDGDNVFESDDEFNDDGIEQIDNSFMADFNDSDIGSFALNVSASSFFELVEEGSEIMAKERDGEMLELLWSVPERIDDRAKFSGHMAAARRCADSIGENLDIILKNFKEFISEKTDTLSIQMKKNGFDLFVKFKLVGCPKEQAS